MSTERPVSGRPTPAASVRATPDASHRPWWREPMMYLVLGGPAVVVVAAIATGVIAWNGADPVVSEYIENSGRASAQEKAVDSSQLPAQKARNHAATLN